MDEGYLRQVYDEISDENLNYKEYLSPHKISDAGTLELYDEYDLPADPYVEYELRE